MTAHNITASDLEKLLAEVTPGEWYSDGPPWNQIVWTDGYNRMCFMAHSSGLNDERDIANARLIAMAPELARKVIAAERLAEALDMFVIHYPRGINPDIDDAASNARSALTAYREASK